MFFCFLFFFLTELSCLFCFVGSLTCENSLGIQKSIPLCLTPGKGSQHQEVNSEADADWGPEKDPGSESNLADAERNQAVS